MSDVEHATDTLLLVAKVAKELEAVSGRADDDK